MASFKFRCACGKMLAADETMVGKKARCGSCNQIATIPAPPKIAAASTVPVQKAANAKAEGRAPSAASSSISLAHAKPPQETSLWDVEFASELTEPTAAVSSQMPATNRGAPKKRVSLRAKFAGRPRWFNWAAFLAYVAVVWFVSRSSPIGSMLLVMPVFGLAIMIFLFGALWYFAVLCRDSPGQAASLFFALLKSFLTGGSATAAGRRHGTAYRDAPENPSLARPIRIMKLGTLAFAFSVGATILVGIMLGTWTKENLRQHRFDQLRNSAPPPHQFRP